MREKRKKNKMNWNQLWTSFLLCLLIAGALGNASFAHAAEPPADFRSWGTMPSVSTSDSKGYYQITDMRTYGSNLTNDMSAGDSYYNSLHYYSATRITYQKKFSVSYGTKINLSGSLQDNGSGGLNTSAMGTISWNVMEWDQYGGFLWDSGWIETNEAYAVGTDARGKCTNAWGTDYSVGSRSTVAYITILFRFVDETGYDGAGAIEITPANVAEYFPNMFLCFKPFTYTVDYSGYGTNTTINRLGTESISLDVSGISNKTGYDIGWKVTSSSSVGDNWMNGKEYKAAQINTWLSDGNFYNSLFGNVTFKAVYIPKEYSITYYPNGGSGNVITDSFKYDSTYTIRAATTYTKPGYSLSGWNKLANGTGGGYTAGESGTWTSTSNISLYAQWTPNIYTIMLDNQGATTAGTEKYYQKYDIGNYSNAGCTTVTSSITVPQKNGYKFNGYYTGTNGSGTQYINSSGAISSTKTTFTTNITLYAYWTVDTFAIKYHANGGTGTMADTTANYGSAVTLRGNAFTRTGYTFKGWATSPTGNVVYSNGVSITMPAGTLDLYAVWEKNSYKLTYHANGGSTTATEKIYYYGDAVDLSPAATKDGHTFVGWSTLQNARLPLISYSMPDKAVTLYAIYTIKVSDVQNHEYPSYTGTPSVDNDELYFLVWIKGDSSIYKYYPLTFKANVGHMTYRYELPSTDVSAFVNGRTYCYQIIAWDNAGNKTVLLEGCSDDTPIPPGDVPEEPVKYAQTVEHYKYNAATGSWVWFKDTKTFVVEGRTFTPSYTTPPTGYQADSKDGGGMVTGNKTYKAYYKPINYLVTFHANGGSCNTASKYVAFEGYYGTLPTATKTGQEFAGWNTKQDGTGKTILSSDIYTTAGPTTLYAQYKANTYRIVLDNQGATTAGTLEYFQKYNAGNYSTQECNAAITTIVIPQKTGYTFGGYYTGTNGNGTQYINSAGVIGSIKTTFTADTTLYAKWTVNTYTIRYHANGGSGSMGDTSAAYGNAVMLRSNQFERVGYTFEGWATSVSGSKVYSDLDSVKNLTTTSGGVVNLYAVWTANTYTVTLDNQGATTAGTLEYFQKYGVGNYKDSNYSVPMTSITLPVKTGYTFGGYYTDANGAGQQYINTAGTIGSTKTTFTVDTTLYAAWTENPYTIRYNANGGIGTMADTEAVYDTSVTLRANSFERIGYTFIGWATSPTGSKVYNDLDSVKNLTAASGGVITLYAVWSINVYPVVYDYQTNGGSGASVTEKQVGYGSDIDLSVTAVKDGYTFVGWNTDASATTKLTSLTMTTEPVVLFAIFQKTITVTFVEMGDTGTVTNSVSQTVYNNTKYADFLIGEKTSWSSWENAGWTNETAADADALVSTGGTYRTDKSITLYALYTSDVTVSYDTNGSHASYESQTKPRYYNASGNSIYPAFTIAKAPTLSGNTFVNWIGKSGTEYVPETNAVIKETVCLTAKWDAHPVLEVYNRYFTLEQAQSGAITQEELLKKVIGTDKEDGTLLNGTSVVVKDYSASTFTGITADKEVEITYQATDSFGNTITKTITVVVTDTTVKESKKVNYIRFISSRFYADDSGNLIEPEKGGLELTSIWRTNPSYKAVLESALYNKKVNEETKVVEYFGTSNEVKVAGSGDWQTEKSTWVFTKADIESVKGFVNEHGYGNIREPNALQLFEDSFCNCLKAN